MRDLRAYEATGALGQDDDGTEVSERVTRVNYGCCGSCNDPVCTPNMLLLEKSTLSLLL